MKITEHFHLEQFTSGELRNSALVGIPIVIPDTAKANIRILADTMEKVLAVLQSPIIITSGYRGPIRTEEMGDPETSPHTIGFAADFICPQIDLEDACKIIAGSNIVFDQLIYYHSWAHVGLTKDPRGPRQQVLTQTGTGEFVEGIVHNT